MTENPEVPEKSAVEVIQSRVDSTIVTRGRVVVIGLGGVGSCLIEPLSVFLASVAKPGKPIQVVLVDGDTFSPSNAYRVAIPDYQNKAVAWATKLSGMFLPEQIQFSFEPEYVTVETLSQNDIICGGDCVLMCVDNHATRRLVSKWCSEKSNITLISGGNDGVNDHQDGTGGTVQVYSVSANRDGSDEVYHGEELDKYHPEIANPPDKNPAELDCLELAAAGEPQLVFANLAVASTMCNALLRLMMQPKRPMYDEVCFDIKENVSVPQYISKPEGRP